MLREGTYGCGPTECRSGWGLNLRTPTKQTSTFPAELTGQWYNQVPWSQVIQSGGTD